MNPTEAAREAFPVTRRAAYLNTASMGAVSTTFAATLAELTRRDVGRGRALTARYAAMDSARERVRRQIAALLDCKPQRILLTRSTSAGLAAVIEAIRWEPGDEVVTTDAEHEACTTPLIEQARRRRIRIVTAALPSDAPSVDRLTSLISPRTKLIALSAVAFESGARLPLEAIARAARAAGAAVLVDGAQGAGAFELDPEALGVDFLALPLQKWLCGPEGLGALYVGPKARWLAPGLDGDRITHGLPVLAATAAHLEWLDETLGWPWIHQRTAALARYARRVLGRIDGARLLTPATHAGITTIHHSAARSTTATGELERAGIVVRQLPTVPAFRISTAFFNTEGEVDRAADAIASLHRS